MNYAKIMQEAKKMELKMKEIEKEIAETLFIEKTGNVEITMLGSRKITDVKIQMELLEKDDIEMLEDMILVSVNNVLNKIEKVRDEKLGSITQGFKGFM